MRYYLKLGVTTTLQTPVTAVVSCCCLRSNRLFAAVHAPDAWTTLVGNGRIPLLQIGQLRGPTCWATPL